MKTFEIEVIRLVRTLHIAADSLPNAFAKAALSAGVENKPENFRSWRVIPTAKQVRKTKSLMRGI